MNNLKKATAANAAANKNVNKKNTVSNKKATEEAFEQYKKGFGSYLEFSDATATGEWDASDLEEDKIYHLNQMGGLPILWIKANRRTIARAMKMEAACHDNGMTTPAILVDAHLISEWGMKLIDPLTLQDATPEQVEGSYCIMEGHGRHYGYLLEQMKHSQDQEYKPFDFIFTYKHYNTPEEAGAAYISTNESMTRTTNKDRLEIAADRCKNPLVKAFGKKVHEDGCIAKGAYFWNYGRELSATEIASITKELPDAPTFDEDLTQALELVYEAFKSKFSCSGAEKIYRGVPAAQWAAGKLKDSDDALAEAQVICNKVEGMTNKIYTPILTAKTCNKTHQTRDMVIKALLDKMMAA